MRRMLASRVADVITFLFFSSVAADDSIVLARSDIDYSVNEHGCHQFQGLASWNQEYVSSLCSDAVLTDKDTTASLCSQFADNVEYETSMKLAILNTMYGTTSIPAGGKCAYFCTHDPLNVDGNDAAGSKWKNTDKCSNVVVRATNKLVYENSYDE